MGTMKAEKTEALMQGLAEFVATLKGCLDDGWSTREDLPDIVSAAIKDLAPILHYDDIVAEYNASPEEVFKAAAVGAVDIISNLMSVG